MVKTLAEMPLLVMEGLEGVLSLLGSLTPLIEALAQLLHLFLTTRLRQGTTHELTLIFRYHIGKPASLSFHHRDDDVVSVIMVQAFPDFQEVLLDHTFNARRGVSEAIDLAAYLHARLPVAMRA
jgi:hypothetical protein